MPCYLFSHCGRCTLPSNVHSLPFVLNSGSSSQFHQGTQVQRLYLFLYLFVFIFNWEIFVWKPLKWDINQCHLDQVRNTNLPILSKVKRHQHNCSIKGPFLFLLNEAAKWKKWLTFSSDSKTWSAHPNYLSVLDSSLHFKGTSGDGDARLHLMTCWPMGLSP